MQENVASKPQRMVRKQILITPEQNRRLKLCAATAGVPEADIVRQGVELALAASQGSANDWREGLTRLSGAWTDRDDMAGFVRGLRQGGSRRLARLGLGSGQK